MNLYYGAIEEHRPINQSEYNARLIRAINMCLESSQNFLSCTNLPLTHTANIFLSSPLNTHFAILSSQVSHPKISTGPSSFPVNSPSPVTESMPTNCASHSIPTS